MEIDVKLLQKKASRNVIIIFKTTQILTFISYFLL